MKHNQELHELWVYWVKKVQPLSNTVFLWVSPTAVLSHIIMTQSSSEISYSFIQCPCPHMPSYSQRLGLKYCISLIIAPQPFVALSLPDRYHAIWALSPLLNFWTAEICKHLLPGSFLIPGKPAGRYSRRGLIIALKDLQWWKYTCSQVHIQWKETWPQ